MGFVLGFSPIHPVNNVAEGPFIIGDFILETGRYVPSIDPSRALRDGSTRVHSSSTQIVKHFTIFSKQMFMTKCRSSPSIYTKIHESGQQTSFILSVTTVESSVMHTSSIYAESLSIITRLLKVFSQLFIKSCIMTGPPPNSCRRNDIQLGFDRGYLARSKVSSP